jgi:hypothetical protein
MARTLTILIGGWVADGSQGGLVEPAERCSGGSGMPRPLSLDPVAVFSETSLKLSCNIDFLQ